MQSVSKSPNVHLPSGYEHYMNTSVWPPTYSDADGVTLRAADVLAVSQGPIAAAVVPLERGVHIGQGEGHTGLSRTNRLGPYG